MLEQESNSPIECHEFMTPTKYPELLDTSFVIKPLVLSTPPVTVRYEKRSVVSDPKDDSEDYTIQAFEPRVSSNEQKIEKSSTDSSI